jgi:hypothetical protein
MLTKSFIMLATEAKVIKLFCHWCSWQRSWSVYFWQGFTTMRGNQLPVGSMVPRHVLQLLFSEKLQNYSTPTTNKAREKISAALESLEFYKFFDVYLT